jgi:signal transduction histidine kinase
MSTHWRSIDRRLPLLISGLLLAAVVVFAWAAYRRVQHILLAAAGPRIKSASVAIDVLFAQSMVAYDGRLVSVASDPAVADFLRTGRQGQAARQALARVWSLEAHSRGRVELRRADGTVALDTATDVFPPASKWVARTIDTAALSPGSSRVGPFMTVGDSSYYEGLAPVGAGLARSNTSSDTPAARSKVLGYVTDFRFLSGASAQVVRNLIGPHTTMLVGSPSTGAWSDLDHPVRAPPVDVGIGAPQVFEGRRGQGGIGVATAIAGTPWVLWVEQPFTEVLAPIHPLLGQIATLAALVIIAGAAGGWFLSRRVTRPIVSLTSQAERLAAGPDPGVVRDAAGDEVMRLDDAFRRMAQRVEESLSTATVARAEAEAQTREARALADELEQQVEEGQSLSEELEQANDYLQKSVVAADAARGEAEAANRVKVDFLASMSHELRTPLNAIAGYVDLLEMEVAGPVSGEQRRYLERVKRAQALLLRRIDDMLNFAKIDSGTLTYTISNVPLDETLSGLVALMQPLMAQRGLTFDYRPPAPHLTVRADREKCEQIVLNILSNAMKFTEAGGRVVIECACRGEQVAVSVSDTGVGIPQDKLAVVFEPFIQVDPSLTRQRDGTGLGLAISRQLAHGMGGDLHAVSTVGRGSTFTLTLPSVGAALPDTAISVSLGLSTAAVANTDGERRAPISRA